MSYMANKLLSLADSSNNLLRPKEILCFRLQLAKSKNWGAKLFLFHDMACNITQLIKTNLHTE